jgi:argininosuccinate lyase
MQLTKEILFPAITELRSCIDMMQLMLSELRVNNDILQDPKYSYLFSVEKVNELVNQGIPFRDAYKQVGNMIEEGKFSFDLAKGLQHNHEGSIGNLCNAAIEEEMSKQLQKFN